MSIYSIFALAHTAVVIALSLRLLYRCDITSAGRLGWFITLLVLPVIGSIAYLLFGEVYISRNLIERHQNAVETVRANADSSFQEHQALDRIPVRYQSVFRYAASINGFMVTDRNRIELLENADVFLSRMVADIDAAQERISILYYIWLDDHTGTQVAEALMRAAARGVKCRVMVDEIGSRILLRSKLWKRMQESDVDCAIAMPLENPFSFRLLNRFDLRNHRKITVIDGKTGYCGSQNCTDPAYWPKAKFAPWVDIMTRFQGPAVRQFEFLFMTDWLGTGRDFPPPQDPVPMAAPPGDVMIQIRGTGPLKRRHSAAQSTAGAIQSATRELMLTTPYFVPDATMLNAICMAAYSGVEVTLTVPARNDSWIVGAASRSHYSTLLEAGVHLYEYNQGLLHSKIMTIDGVLTIIGSSNLDLRSFDLNYENDMLIFDPKTTAEIRERQLSYLRDATRIERSDVDSWSVPKRIWYNSVATLGPML